MFIRDLPDEAAWSRLLSQLGGLLAGCGQDLVTVLVSCLCVSKDAGREAVGKMIWNACQLGSLEPWLVKHESAELSRHGSHSMTAGYAVRPPYPGATSLKQGVDRFFEEHPTRIHPVAMEVANQALRDLLSRGGAKFKLWDTVRAAFAFRKRANCGWPWFVRAVESPLWYLNEAERILADDLDISHASAYPGSLGTRSVPRGPGKLAKSRVIFGISRVSNILATKVWGPLYEDSTTKVEFCSTQGRAVVDQVMTTMLDDEREKLSLDFKNFDASVPNEVIDCVFDRIEEVFEPSAAPLINFIREGFKRTGIFVPGKDQYLGGEYRLGGIPSGHKLTSLIGGYVNYWVMHYCAARAGGSVARMVMCGDDGVVIFSHVESHDQIKYYALKDLGMLIDSDKTASSYDEVKFLQMIHHRRYRRNGVCIGVRPIMRVLNGMMGRESPLPPPPEDIDMGIDEWLALLDSIRWIQQVDNASAHPRWPILAKWLLDTDGGIVNALMRFVRNDHRILAAAGAVLTTGDACKTRVAELYKSPTVQWLTQQCMKS